MIRLLILPCLCAFVGSTAQFTISATYNSGDIPTSLFAYESTCNGPLSVLSITLPPGDNYTVSGIDITYAMTAANQGWMADQQSQIHCQNTGLTEPIYGGSGNNPGTYLYNRSGVDIANGSYPGGTTLVFEMRAWRLWGGIDCGTFYNQVDNGTWTITVNHGDEVVNPKVGIQTDSPSQTLDVNGKMQLGDDTTAPEPGTIRWNAATQDFEGFNGAEWLSLTTTRSRWGSDVVTEVFGASDDQGGEDHYFGYSVALSDKYAVAGVPGFPSEGDTLRGKAVVFERIGTQWIEVDTLIASDGDTVDQFGISVAISGDYIIVGSPGYNAGGILNQGKAYVYQRSGSEWTEQAMLSASDAQWGALFGYDVSIDDDYAVIGAPFHSDTVAPTIYSGQAYLFKRDGSSWTQEAILTASNAAHHRGFGYSVSLYDDWVAVGSPTSGYGDVVGYAYVFKQEGLFWIEQAALHASDSMTNDWFGFDVAINGTHLVVGAPRAGVTGQAYIYARQSGVWTEQAILKPVNTSNAVNFGFSVALSSSGNYAIIGMPDYENARGKVSIRQRTGATWFEDVQLTPSDGDSGHAFGISVQILDDIAMVGAYTYAQSPGEQNIGKVYFFGCSQ
ncbi:MAG: FG-GAP repeat protein [Saprospiraceae bacterium]|nr:FG-GAP repeat protein [Saprospiraceae bacterium]